MSVNDLKTAAFIAYKSILRGNKSTLVLIIFILSLSFINMMFTAGILKGLSELIPQLIIKDVSSYITISSQETPRVKEFIPSQSELRAELATIPGILATTRRYVLAGSLAFDKDKSGQYKRLSSSILGIDPAEDAKIMGIDELMKDGSFLSDTDTDQIILSSALAGGYGNLAPSDLGGARVGDKITLMYGTGAMRTYKVKGIYSDLMGIYENFITSKEAESVLGVSDSASQILVSVDPSRATLEDYRSQIKAVAPNLKVQTYEDFLGSFVGLLNALNLIAVIVSVISIAVASVTIFVVIYVNALNKRRQIGILRAIGIKKTIIIFSYIFQSLFYTAASLAVGSIVTFAILYPLLLRYPIDVDFGAISLYFTPGWIIFGIASLVVAGFLSGYLPSRLVARKDILTSIWG